MARLCSIGAADNRIDIGAGRPLCVIAGPCVLEGVEMALQIGEVVGAACRRLGLPFIFKASFDKANRTSVSSPRGPGLDEGLAQLAKVRDRLGVPVTTDLHAPEQAEAVAEVVDILQIPAFLCRQTDLLVAAGKAAAARGRAVNVKKGQFVAPEEMKGPVKKLEKAGCRNVMLTERGTFFGYHRLVNDFIGVGDLMTLDLGDSGSPPVCFDATHSAQLPGLSATTGGRRERIPLLAKAAAAAGVHAMFMECHPEPEKAHSDAATALHLSGVPALLETLAKIVEASRDATAR